MLTNRPACPHGRAATLDSTARSVESAPSAFIISKTCRQRLGVRGLGDCISLVGKDFTLTLALSLKGEGIFGLIVGAD